MSCGIYKITNIINKKCYIGQSVNIESRWYHHINSLNKNKHANDYLQNAWNKYGQASFSFEILCLCSKDKLNELETLKKAKEKYPRGSIDGCCRGILKSAGGYHWCYI